MHDTEMMNRRRFERVEFFSEACLTVLPQGPTSIVRTFDLSLGGVGLVTQAGLQRGQFVAIAFRVKPTAGRAFGKRIIGKVVHLVADADANRVGIEFSEPLSERDHPELVKKLMSL